MTDTLEEGLSCPNGSAPDLNTFAEDVCTVDSGGSNGGCGGSCHLSSQASYEDWAEAEGWDLRGVLSENADALERHEFYSSYFHPWRQEDNE